MHAAEAEEHVWAGAQLVSAALQQWLIEENGSADDITAVVVFFQTS